MSWIPHAASPKSPALFVQAVLTSSRRRGTGVRERLCGQLAAKTGRYGIWSQPTTTAIQSTKRDRWSSPNGAGPLRLHLPHLGGHHECHFDTGYELGPRWRILRG